MPKYCIGDGSVQDLDSISEVSYSAQPIQIQPQSTTFFGRKVEEVHHLSASEKLISHLQYFEGFGLGTFMTGALANSPALAITGGLIGCGTMVLDAVVQDNHGMPRTCFPMEFVKGCGAGADIAFAAVAVNYPAVLFSNMKVAGSLAAVNSLMGLTCFLPSVKLIEPENLPYPNKEN